MKYLFTIVVFLVSIAGALGQLKGKVLKLEGDWQFKGSTGFEEWRLVDGELFGKAYRIGKMGDTSIVEEMMIRRVDKNMVLTSKTFNFHNDSLHSELHVFIGGRRKMNFINVDTDIPHSIRYSMGCFNRNKLKIDIFFTEGQKAKTIVLFRKKDN